MTTRSRPRANWRPAFLRALAVTGVVTTAARNAGVERKTAYRARNSNLAFARQWDNALDEALDAVEQAVMRASIEGTDMQTARWVLSRRRPEMWGDKVEVTGRGGGPVQVDHAIHLPDAQTWAEIVRIREEHQGAEVAEAEDGGS